MANALQQQIESQRQQISSQQQQLSELQRQTLERPQQELRQTQRKSFLGKAVGALTARLKRGIQRERVAKPLSQVSQQQAQFEAEIAQKAPEYAKPELVQIEYQKAKGKISSRIEELESRLKIYNQSLEKARAKDSNDDERDALTDIKATQGEINVLKSYTEDPIKAIKGVNTGIAFREAGARANFIEQKEKAKVERREAIKAAGFSSVTEYAKAKPILESLAKGTATESQIAQLPEQIREQITYTTISPETSPGITEQSIQNGNGYERLMSDIGYAPVSTRFGKSYEKIQKASVVPKDFLSQIGYQKVSTPFGERYEKADFTGVETFTIPQDALSKMGYQPKETYQPGTQTFISSQPGVTDISRSTVYMRQPTPDERKELERVKKLPIESIKKAGIWAAEAAGNIASAKFIPRGFERNYVGEEEGGFFLTGGVEQLPSGETRYRQGTFVRLESLGGVGGRVLETFEGGAEFLGEKVEGGLNWLGVPETYKAREGTKKIFALERGTMLSEYPTFTEEMKEQAREEGSLLQMRTSPTEISTFIPEGAELENILSPSRIGKGVEVGLKVAPYFYAPTGALLIGSGITSGAEGVARADENIKKEIDKLYQEHLQIELKENERYLTKQEFLKEVEPQVEKQIKKQAYINLAIPVAVAGISGAFKVARVIRRNVPRKELLGMSIKQYEKFQKLKEQASKKVGEFYKAREKLWSSRETFGIGTGEKLAFKKLGAVDIKMIEAAEKQFLVGKDLGLKKGFYKSLSKTESIAFQPYSKTVKLLEGGKVVEKALPKVSKYLYLDKPIKMTEVSGTFATRQGQLGLAYTYPKVGAKLKDIRISLIKTPKGSRLSLLEQFKPVRDITLKRGGKIIELYKPLKLETRAIIKTGKGKVIQRFDDFFTRRYPLEVKEYTRGLYKARSMPQEQFLGRVNLFPEKSKLAELYKKTPTSEYALVEETIRAKDLVINLKQPTIFDYGVKKGTARQFRSIVDIDKIYKADVSKVSLVKGKGLLGQTFPTRDLYGRLGEIAKKGDKALALRDTAVSKIGKQKLLQIQTQLEKIPKTISVTPKVVQVTPKVISKAPKAVEQFTTRGLPSMVGGTGLVITRQPSSDVSMVKISPQQRTPVIDKSLTINPAREDFVSVPRELGALRPKVELGFKPRELSREEFEERGRIRITPIDIARERGRVDVKPREIVVQKPRVGGSQAIGVPSPLAIPRTPRPRPQRPKPGKPDKIIPPPVFGDEEKRKKIRVPKRKTPGEEFLAVTKRYGKEVVIGRGRDLGKIVRFGKARVKGTLGATLKVRTTKGKQIKLTPTRDFRKSKVDPLAIVQRRERRLGSLGERREIKQTRRKALSLA